MKKSGGWLAGWGLGLLLLASAATASAESLGLSAEYVLAGSGARTAALGSAFSGTADDASALVWNPGGLGQANLTELAFSHAFLDADRYYDQLLFSQPVANFGTLGVGLLTFNQAQVTMAGTADAGPLRDAVLMLAYGREFFPGFSWGLNVQGHSLTLGHQTASGLGADTGVLYRPLPELAAGVTLQNAVPPLLRLEAADTPYRRLLRPGLSSAWWDGRLLVLAEADKFLDESSWAWGGGLEVKLWPRLTLRAGYREQTVAAGLGFIYDDWRLDYAALRAADQKLSHRVSLVYTVGAYNARLAAGAQTFSRNSLNKVCRVGIDLPDKQLIRQWKLSIHQRSTGKLVKTFSGFELPEAIVWDGKDEQNNFLPEGRYDVRLAGSDAEGNQLRSNLLTVAILETAVIKITNQKDEQK
ncbi:MAG: hypothetical protein HGA76_06995 [Candidatus Firestonebacteria bacterium]|nr:hypothetical protein [Candidatus Firestonebacteria bacterium]